MAQGTSYGLDSARLARPSWQNEASVRAIAVAVTSSCRVDRWRSASTRAVFLRRQSGVERDRDQRTPS